MKTILVIIITIALQLSARSQIVASSCSAPDSIIRLYKTDADVLSLYRIYQTNSPFKDSVIIPFATRDTMLRALMTFYNCTIPERDTILQHNIHIEEYSRDTTFLWPNYIKLDVDGQKNWVKDFFKNTSNVTDSVVKKMLDKYHFNTRSTSTLFGAYYITLISDSNYNMKQLAKEWLKVPGVYDAFSDLFSFGRSNRIIVDSINDHSLNLSFGYGWMDCPSGCLCYKSWSFKVFYDCTISYRGELHSTDPWCYLNVPNSYKTTTTISPNPFHDFIEVHSSEHRLTYRLYNTKGQVLHKGMLPADGKIESQSWPTGIYMLQLVSENNVETIKIVKE